MKEACRRRILDCLARCPVLNSTCATERQATCIQSRMRPCTLRSAMAITRRRPAATAVAAEGALRGAWWRKPRLSPCSIRVGRKIPLPHEKWGGDGLTSDVDLVELTLGPIHGILGRHALDGLCVHINDDVLGHDLGCLARRGPLVASESPSARCFL